MPGLSYPDYVENQSSDGAGTSWARASKVACVERDSYVAVLALDVTPIGAPRILEGSAAVIWRTLISTPRPEQDIIAEVAEEFELEPSAIAADVRAFLRDLESQRLACEASLNSDH